MYGHIHCQLNAPGLRFEKPHALCSELGKILHNYAALLCITGCIAFNVLMMSARSEAEVECATEVPGRFGAESTIRFYCSQEPTCSAKANAWQILARAQHMDAVCMIRTTSMPPPRVNPALSGPRAQQITNRRPWGRQATPCCAYIVLVL